LARSTGKLVSITVEGKVSEPFGPTVQEWRTEASSGKSQRLTFLCEQLGIQSAVPDALRYQLLHRAASAVIEAKRFSATDAVMLVHSFSQSSEWFQDYAAFVSLLGAVRYQKTPLCRLASVPAFLYIWLGFAVMLRTCHGKERTLANAPFHDEAAPVAFYT
jgi:hypothetical protein